MRGPIRDRINKLAGFKRKIFHMDTNLLYLSCECCKLQCRLLLQITLKVQFFGSSARLQLSYLIENKILDQVLKLLVDEEHYVYNG